MPSVLLERSAVAGMNRDDLRSLSFSGLSKPCCVGSLVEVVITAHGDAKGKIVVHAQPPSGQSIKCHIFRRDNVYTAQFTPYEVGDWQVSVLYDGEHIRGSPFLCKVFDANLVEVHGLEAGSIGEEIVFNVDARNAGSGTITVEALHIHRPVRTFVEELDVQLYRAHFIPAGAGKYEIHVFLNDVEIHGSPFLLDVVDTSSVAVSGDGLSVANVDSFASFMIKAPAIDSQDLAVTITAPSGKKKHARIVGVNESTYRAEWKPIETGEHYIEVQVYSQSIAGSPFTCNVGDPDLVTVRNLQRYIKHTELGSPLSFTIDASAAGSGNLEILINDGKVNCRVRELGNKTYLATYTPMQPIGYTIEMMFNKSPVKGSPWRVETMMDVGEEEQKLATFPFSNMMLAAPVNLSQIQNGALPTYAYLASPTYQPDATVSSSVETTSFSTLAQAAGRANEKWAEVYGKGLKTACVGKVASFEITAPCLSSDDIDATVTYTNGKKIPCKVVALSTANYMCEYIPTEVGVYRIDLKICGHKVDGSPFLVSTYDPMKVLIEPFSGDVVGKPLQFMVDASEAGKGQLEISINKGQIPNNVQLQGAGKCLVTFIPEKAGTYVIDVTLNGDLVRGCPVRVEIYDNAAERAAAHTASRSSSSYSLNTTGSPVQKYLTKSNLSSALSLSPRTHTAAPARTSIEQKEKDFTGRTGDVASPSLTPVPRTFGSTISRTGGATGMSSSTYLTSSRGVGGAVVGGLKSPQPVEPSESVDSVSSNTWSAFAGTTTKASKLRMSPNLNDAYSEMRSADTGVSVQATAPSAVGHEEKVAMSDQLVQKNEFICVENFNMDFRTLADHWKAKSQENMLPAYKKPSLKYFDTEAMKSLSQSEISVLGLQSPLSTTVDQLSSGGPTPTIAKSPRLVESTSKGFAQANKVDQQSPPPHGKETVSAVPPSPPFENYMLSKSRGEPLSVDGYKPQKRDMDAGIGKPAVIQETKTGAGGDAVSSKSHRHIIMQEEHATSFDKAREKTTGDSEHFTQREKAEISSRYSPPVIGREREKVVEKSTGSTARLEPGLGAGPGPTPTPVPGSTAAPLLKTGFKQVGGVPTGLPLNVNDVQQHRPKNMKMLWHQTVIESSTNGVLRLGATARYVLKNFFTQPDDLQVSVTHLNATVPMEFRVEKLTDNELTVQFVPPDVGAYKVHFSSMDDPHPSSPLILKVYNPDMVKISDIIGKVAGKPVQFTVDATHAGYGDLEIAIKDENGLVVPSKVMSQDRHANFTVSFLPQNVGKYGIHVTFNGEHVEGSPFICDVNYLQESPSAAAYSAPAALASNSVTAAAAAAAAAKDIDECLSCTVPGIAAAKRKVKFEVATNDKDRNVNVSIHGPDEKDVPVSTGKTNASTYLYEFVPTVVGDYRIDVALDDVPFPRSPFTCKVYDARKIKVTGIAAGVVNSPVHFIVDAGEAGVGNLEVAVNDGRIPSMAQSLGQHRYDISFVPQEATVHTITIRFNGESVPGSPFSCEVRSSNVVSVSGPGLERAAARKATFFMVNTANASTTAIEVSIKDPASNEVPHTISGNPKAGYRVEYTPQIVGVHTISVKYGDALIADNPSSVKVYDASRVKLFPVDGGVVNKAASFLSKFQFCYVLVRSAKVDASSAGAGSMEIIVSVDGRNVPNYVQSEGNAKFKVTFTPQEPKPHMISVKFNDEPVPGSPMMCKVNDIAPCVATGEGLSFACINEAASFLVCANKYADEECNVVITAPDGSAVPVKCFQQADGNYRVEYHPIVAGAHQIEVTFGDHSVPDSPFICEVLDPKAVKYTVPKSLTLGKEVVVKVSTKNAGNAELRATVFDADGKAVSIEVSRSTPHEAEIRFKPLTLGLHSLSIALGRYPVVERMALLVDDVEEARVFVYGTGLERAVVGESARFFIDSKMRKGELKVLVSSPDNRVISNTITKKEDGIYEIAYAPPDVGFLTVSTYWNGKPLQGSPFKVLAVDPSKVSVMNVTGRISLKAAEENEIRIDTSHAGPGFLKADARGPFGKVPVSIVQESSTTYRLSFTPIEEGDYSLYLYWSGSLVPNCPLLAVARLEKTIETDPTKVVVSGDGLTEARTKLEAEFIIDGRQAGPGFPSCLLKGQKADVPISLSQIDSFVWRASYIPHIPGHYKLEIKWSDRYVKGSPFRVQVFASGDASKVLVKFDVFQHGVVGQQLKTTVDTRMAGSGELMAQCAGPTKPALCDMIDHQDGTYTMIVKPVEVGNHVLTTKFNGEHVPGSPHSVFISSPPDSSKVRVYGSGIEHGILSTFDSTFYVDTKGAGAGQLTIRVRGPKGAFNVEMTRENKKSRLITCRYEPKEPGDYRIDVKWAGEHVPDSPFSVMIFDTQTELDRFLSGQMVNPPFSYPLFPPGWIGPPPPGVLVSPSPSNTIYSPIMSSPSLPYVPAPQSPYFTSKSVH